MYPQTKEKINDIFNVIDFDQLNLIIIHFEINAMHATLV